jgi:hypothetical protein
MKTTVGSSNVSILVNDESASPTPKDIIHVFNFHGAFFKKHVLRKLSEKLRVTEEFGTRFGQTRVADIIARDGFGLFLVVECKKVAKPKKWIFLKHLNQRYRRARSIDRQGTLTSVLDDSPPPHPLVCSEGFEVGWSPRFKAWKADQDPIFQAAAQLSGAYLGFVERRFREHNKSIDNPEVFVPALVTNAELAFVKSDFVVNEATGEADLSSKTLDVPFVLLRHPFPQLDNDIDFRDAIADDYEQRFQETIYVINIGRMDDFLADTHRERLRDLESAINPRNFI